MKYTIIIPAREASTRLPGKMLADVHGLPLILRTALQAQKSSAQRIIIATDSQAIADVTTAHGFETIMTDHDHPSGTDRLAQVVTQLDLPDDEIIVNVQGDEPLIDPDLIHTVAHQLSLQAKASIATCAYPITDVHRFLNPNVVKVIRDTQGFALTFSRAPIPWDRAGFKQITQIDQLKPDFPALHHIGLYAYRCQFLKQYPLLNQTPLEKFEQLEQLRALEHGYSIFVALTKQAPLSGVDTQEDLDNLRHYLSQHPTL
ncbi:3-deoxy-manno-octulosonate cytidylyltransferase [Basilea psittacipulmonis]|uniref:3-deoxy-manno-octulosonate cytidylyltransferase n=1 Tax=Basilea psittacipulmonis DSM 24701 TaxID=1072685 RepID=A0A077DG28_9BURK|nr:3-deoxy-manno-octulosonate cytidylyltransferase [Basilea psittacipulmonis]AIL32407.1 3-deoxy-manno-octulosonate cytidylyltransferase [Basilea psittacipulmonis DSM 24701]